MSANLSVVLGADTTGLKQNITQAKNILAQYSDTANKATNSIKQNADVSKEQVAAYSRVIKSLDKINSGSMASSQAQKALATQVKELKMQWDGLSESAKNGAFGKSLSDTLTSGTAQLKQMQAQMAEVNASFGNLGGDKPLKKQLKQMTNELTQMTAKYRAMSDAEKNSAGGQELQRKMSDLRNKAGKLQDTIGDVNQEIKVLASDTKNLDVFNDALGIGADAMSLYSSVIAKVTGNEAALKDAIATVMTVQSAANLMTKVTNALQSSSAIMLKIRAIQEKAAAVAINIKTAAENKGKVATVAATAAQKAFNVVAKANPYVLLASAVIAVGTALLAFSRKTKEATESEKDMISVSKNLKTIQDEAQKSFAEKASETQGKYKLLQARWNSLKTDMEKKKFLQDNKAIMEELGKKIGISAKQANTLSGAYKILVTDVKKVTQALIEQAKAQVAADNVTKLLTAKESEYQRIKAEESKKLSDFAKNQRAIVGTKVIDTTKTTFGPNGPTYGTRDYTQEEANAKIEEERLKRIQSLQKRWAAIRNKLDKEIVGEAKKAATATTEVFNKIMGNSDDTATNKTKDKLKNKKKELDAYETLNKQISDLEKKEKGLAALGKDTKAISTELNKLKNKKFDIDFSIEYGENAKSPEALVAKLDKELSNLQFALRFETDETKRQQLQKQIQELVEKREGYKIQLSFDKEKFAKEWSDAMSNNDSSNSTLEQRNPSKFTPIAVTKDDKFYQMLDMAQAKLDDLSNKYAKATDQLNKMLEVERKAGDAGVDLTDEQNSEMEQQIALVNALGQSYAELRTQIDNAMSTKSVEELSKAFRHKLQDGIFSTVDTLGNLNSASMNIYSTWKGLKNNLQDKDAFEQVTTVIGATISTIQEAIGVYETISRVIELAGEIAEIASAKKVAAATAEGAAVTAEAAAETTANTTKAASEVASNTTEMASDLIASSVNQVLTATENTAAYASIPFAGPALAAAAMATYQALWASAAIPVFAKGGIVNGATSIGDYNIARVNDGEMILSGTQQKRLFDLLNGGSTHSSLGNSIGGNVVFKVKGKDLVGTLNNHYKRSNKI